MAEIKSKKDGVTRYTVKYSKDNDYKVLWPFEKAGSDTTKKYIYSGSALTMGFIFWALASLFIFVMLWRPLPYLPFPETTSNQFKLGAGCISWTLSWLLPLFDNSYARSFNYFLGSAKDGATQLAITFRYFLTLGLTLGAGFYGCYISWTPSGGVTHKKGKELFEKMKAFLDLKAQFGKMVPYGSSKLIVGASVPFNPMVDTIETMKKNTYIERPKEIQKTMTIVTGATGRGKTNLLYFLYVSQIVNRIKKYHDRRLILLDTVKGDYQKYFKNKEDYYLIAPQKLQSEHWAIAKDIYNPMLAKSFMQGKIPQNEASQEIWNPAATTIGTGCIVLLQSIAPLEWTMGHLSYVLNKTGAQLKNDLWNVYPECQQILSGAKETVASVITTLGTYKDDLMELARLMDGYDTKHSILYSTTRTLRIPQYLKWLRKEYREMSDIVDQKDGESTEKKEGDIKDKSMSKPEARGTSFLNIVAHMNSQYSDWTWGDMVDYIKSKDIRQLLEFGDLYSEKIFANILQFHEEWDKIERRKKLTLCDWLKNPQTVAKDGTTIMDREVLIIQPFQDSPSLTKGLIKGMLYVMNKIILGMPDSSDRDITMIVDEFATYNGIEEFVRESFSLWRSKGVDIIVALQDFSMLEDIGYSQAFVDFLISNVGSLIIAGHNAGKTSQTMEEMLGERTITKVHKSVGSSAGGKNVSTEIQEHQEVVVHSSLINQLGADIPSGKIKYLYICGKLNPVYVLEVPLIRYPAYDTGVYHPRLTPDYQPIVFKDLNDFYNDFKPQGQGGQKVFKEGTVKSNQESTYDKPDRTETKEDIVEQVFASRRK